MTARVRTGAEYLQALRDNREVYLDGKRVEDVTTEPGLSHGVGSLDEADRAMDHALRGGGETDYSAVGALYGKRWSPASPPVVAATPG